jgi:hypothetical protein
MTGGQAASAHLLATKTNASVVWFGSPNNIRDAAETAPTETTTAFRGLFEQTRGVAARSTTSDHLVVSGTPQPIPTKLGGIQFRSLQ